MIALSLNDVANGRILSDGKVCSIVLPLVEKYSLLPEQREVLLDFAERLVSIFWAISLPREKKVRKQWLSEELDLILSQAKEEGEFFREALRELLQNIEQEVSNVSL